MKSPLIAAGLLVALCSTTAACSTAEPSATTAGAGSPSSASVAPSNPTPSPTPSPSTKAFTQDDVEKAVVTAKELGSPWKPSSGALGEAPWGDSYCPQPHRARARIDALARFWQGYYNGKGGGGAVELAALPGADGAAAKAAYQADLTSCKKFTWKAAGKEYYSVDKAAGPVAVAGADEVIGGMTRRDYAVVKGSPHLIQVSRVLIVREGQFLVEVNYSNYSEATAGPGKGKGAGFTPLQHLATEQVAKLSNLA